MRIINKRQYKKIIDIFSWLILILFSMGIFACAEILYGYKKVKYVDEEWSKGLASKIKIPEQNLIFFDSFETTELKNITCGSNQSVQPLQFHYVHGNSFVSSYYNCYAGGNLRKLNWKIKDPQHDIELGDCIFSNNEANDILRRLTNNEGANIFVIVFSSMFKRQAEDLVNSVNERSEKHPIVLINIDAYYISILESL